MLEARARACSERGSKRIAVVDLPASSAPMLWTSSYPSSVLRTCLLGIGATNRWVPTVRGERRETSSRDPSSFAPLIFLFPRNNLLPSNFGDDSTIPRGCLSRSARANLCTSKVPRTEKIITQVIEILATTNDDFFFFLLYYFDTGRDTRDIRGYDKEGRKEGRKTSAISGDK